ncbi:MAG: adenine nucleotide alpha hydrolase [Proteobacteria bacterium]|nr:adenine nucleotide alpha hydrolase [Pseudomonadota bacterium]
MLMSWSGGKDCCMALYELQTAAIPIAALLTTLTRDHERISMHGVRRILLERQAASLGLPLDLVLIPKDASNGAYEAAMGEALDRRRRDGVRLAAFGDLFLEDVRDYREALLARHGMQGVYPVWGRPTREFVRAFIKLGFKAVVTCVDGQVLSPSFAGANIDERFLSALPPLVDPCGENGEFHSFVYDGPNFAEPVRFSIGEIVQRDRFWFRDLLPGGDTGQPGAGEQLQHVES